MRLHKVWNIINSKEEEEFTDTFVTLFNRPLTLKKIASGPFDTFRQAITYKYRVGKAVCLGCGVSYFTKGREYSLMAFSIELRDDIFYIRLVNDNDDIVWVKKEHFCVEMLS